MARMKDVYKNDVAPALMKKFQYKSVMQIPKIDKIVVNVGAGDAKDNTKVIDTIITELSTAICLYTVRTQTLTLAIYTYVSRGNDGIAAALATILSLTTVVSLLLFMKLSKSKDVTL